MVDKSRLTSEERQMLRSKEEVAEFQENKAKWESFYQKMIKPSSATNYQEHIKKQ